jgi:PAS domain S-box-containing protein
MTRKKSAKRPSQSATRASSDAPGGAGVFEHDWTSGAWTWGEGALGLLGFSEASPPCTSEEWRREVFVDDQPKIIAALEEAKASGEFYVEFRIKRGQGDFHWLAGKGRSDEVSLRGAFYDIAERKQLEARLLALNETLEGRIAELRAEAHALEVLNRTGAAVAAEHDLEQLVQMVTDAGVELSGAQFGAFFYNVLREDGEAYTLYTLSGASREAFAKFPMPRNTAIFEPTFRGQGPVRSADIIADARYGKSAPYHGMPEGHLPVRSYLAIPVMSRNDEVLGGLFFGHAQPGIFTDRAQRLVQGLAAQAAVAIDNSRLYQRLQSLNKALEQRAEEKTQQLMASTDRLEDTERRFRILVEGVTDYAIFMLGPDGKIINWNPGAQRIKGYAREEIIGQHFSRFYTEADRAQEVPRRALETARLTGKFETEGWRIRKDGTQFWASAIINAIRDKDGEIIGFAKITRDLTERRAAEERLQQSQKMEGIGQLTGGVAHDFNNLLTIIIGNLEALQRHLGDENPDRERLSRSAVNAMRGARRAESVTQRLLAFSRQQPLAPKSIDLGRLVSGMSDLLRRTLGESVSVETVLAGGLWRAHADPNQLEVAVLNLAINARDAMPDGGKLTIETANVHLDERYATAQAEVLPGQYVMLAITDNGAGMSEEVKAKAFDPFFTTKEIGHGTGLGLSQVYGFVKQSRGHVKIYSEIGQGTTIKIYLPRFLAHSEAVEEEEPAQAAMGSGHETILVVEDDEDVRAYSSGTLRDLGYQILEADTGPAALRVLEAHPEIALLFTDVGLPGGMTGRELADEARKRRANLKVLFTTGYARNAIVHGGKLDQGVELLPKPFTQGELSAKLRDILDARTVPARVLVVEDEVMIQMLAVDYLEEAGLRADTAGAGADALNKLRLIPGGVDAVVVDLGLPDRSGDGLVREIRSNYPQLPIVIASGRESEDVQSLLSEAAPIAFVGKPYTSQQLLDALRKTGLRF